jgi:hypothetical protein
LRPRAAKPPADQRVAPGANTGCEFRLTADGRGGVFATRGFAARALVLAGEIDKVLDGPSATAQQVGEHIFVTHKGLTDQVNHSCDPNVGVRCHGDGAHDFVARRPIEAGEEITVDVAMCSYETRPARPRCQCGAGTCRGHVTGWKELTAERKAEYRDFAAPFLLALDARQTG